ncbi:MAG: hypothetical protein HC817_12265 [Saprospiraceae bacterium]|nr:hypothetical protein [Saprospiraceae bacterium]
MKSNLKSLEDWTAGENLTHFYIDKKMSLEYIFPLPPEEQEDRIIAFFENTISEIKEIQTKIIVPNFGASSKNITVEESNTPQ